MNRRGAALLLLLAALALLMPICLGLSRTVATAALGDKVGRAVEQVDDLLAAADGPIQAWLASETTALVLPPDTPYPAALVLHDRFESGGSDCTLTIVAWDQHGMVPLAIARTPSPLRLALPREVTRAIDDGPRENDRPGIDWYCSDGGDDAFPPAPAVIDNGEAPSLRWPTLPAARIGAWIATHGSGAINVNTAPLPLVDAALRELGRGGLDAIVAARQKGERAIAPAPPATRGDRGRERRADGSLPAVTLVSNSDCFAFRIDARAGRARKSWWSIYRTHDGAWRLEQRLLIPAS
jgi:hypothetical protein